MINIHGIVKAPLNEIDQIIQNAIHLNVMPGVVVSIATKGITLKEQAYGYAYRYLDDQFTEAENPIYMRKDTIFDIASITKIFTSIAVMQLFEEGTLSIEDAVVTYIPEFAENNKEKITIRQLLTHTSGFESGIPLYKMGKTREERIAIVLKHGLVNLPGTNYKYSDLNMITLGVLVERLTGQRLDEYIK